MMEQMQLETEILSPRPKPANENKITRIAQIDGLADIANPATSLVIWQRQISSCIFDWLSDISPQNWPHGQVIARPDQLNTALLDLFGADLFEAEQFGAEQESAASAAHMLRQDITQLGQLYAAIAKSDQVDIRLKVIQHDACWKFHLDNVALRLVTTYIGASTQYVVPELSKQALSEQKAYNGPLENIPEQAVAIFKGSRSASDNGIVHRSPPIKGTGQTRLFLSINSP